MVFVTESQFYDQYFFNKKYQHWSIFTSFQNTHLNSSDSYYADGFSTEMLCDGLQSKPSPLNHDTLHQRFKPSLVTWEPDILTAVHCTKAHTSQHTRVILSNAVCCTPPLKLIPKSRSLTARCLSREAAQHTPHLFVTRWRSLISERSNQTWGQALTVARWIMPISPPWTWPTCKPSKAHQCLRHLKGRTSSSPPLQENPTHPNALGGSKPGLSSDHRTDKMHSLESICTLTWKPISGTSTDEEPGIDTPRATSPAHNIDQFQHNLHFSPLTSAQASISAVKVKYWNPQAIPHNLSLSWSLCCGYLRSLHTIA